MLPTFSTRHDRQKQRSGAALISLILVQFITQTAALVPLSAPQRLSPSDGPVFADDAHEAAFIEELTNAEGCVPRKRVQDAAVSHLGLAVLERVEGWSPRCSMVNSSVASSFVVGYGHRCHRNLSFAIALAGPVGASHSVQQSHWYRAGERVCEQCMTSHNNGTGFALSRAEGRELLLHDLHAVKLCMEQLVHQNVTIHQYSALASFILNVGCDTFASSKLLRVLNQGHEEAAEQELLKWSGSHHRYNKQLIQRRKTELTLWRVGLCRDQHLVDIDEEDDLAIAALNKLTNDSRIENWFEPGYESSLRSRVNRPSRFAQLDTANRLDLFGLQRAAGASSDPPTISDPNMAALCQDALSKGDSNYYSNNCNCVSKWIRRPFPRNIRFPGFPTTSTEFIDFLKNKNGFFHDVKPKCSSVVRKLLGKDTCIWTGVWIYIKPTIQYDIFAQIECRNCAKQTFDLQLPDIEHDIVIPIPVAPDMICLGIGFVPEPTGATKVAAAICQAAKIMGWLRLFMRVFGQVVEIDQVDVQRGVGIATHVLMPVLRAIINAKTHICQDTFDITTILGSLPLIKVDEAIVEQDDSRYTNLPTCPSEFPREAYPCQHGVPAGQTSLWYGAP